MYNFVILFEQLNLLVFILLKRSLVTLRLRDFQKIFQRNTKHICDAKGVNGIRI